MAALLVLAVSAGAPLLPRKLQRFGSSAYTFSLVVISSLLAIVVVPAWIALLAWHFGVSTELTAADVAQVGQGFPPPTRHRHAAQGSGSDTERAFRRPCGRDGGCGTAPSM